MTQVKTIKTTAKNNKQKIIAFDPLIRPLYVSLAPVSLSLVARLCSIHHFTRLLFFHIPLNILFHLKKSEKITTFFFLIFIPRDERNLLMVFFFSFPFLLAAAAAKG